MQGPDNRRFYPTYDKHDRQLIDEETLATEALTFLGSDPDQARRFFASTGLEPGSIRDAVSEPGFLAVVLDHLTADDALLGRFAAHAGRSPAALARQAQALRERPSRGEA